jgi:hypothetical protein
LGDAEDKDVRDAAMIAAGAVEHYEITRYGPLGGRVHLMRIKEGPASCFLAITRAP